MFKALQLNKSDAGFSAALVSLDDAQLPAGDVLVQVEYSTLNYKDGLAITNTGPVVRSWPMVAGIDGAGTVLESSHPAWKTGDRFIHNGWGLGETRWGLMAERARLSTEVQALVAKAYRLGESDLPTRLRADSEKFEADLSLARARVGLQRAISQLNQALGLLP